MYSTDMRAEIVAALEEEFKRCSKCKELQPREDFSPKKTATDGLHPYCKRCRALYQREIYHSQK